MQIDVRPTSPLRRHRQRIVGALVVAGLLATSAFSVAELASAGEPLVQDVPASDVSHP